MLLSVQSEKKCATARSSSQPSIAGVNRLLFFTCIYRMMDCCTSCKWGLLVINYGEWLGVVAAKRRPVRFSGVPCRTTQPCPASSYRLSSSQMVQKFSLLLFMISVLVVIFTVALLFFFSYFSFQFNETLSRVWCLHGLASKSSWSEFRWKMN